jgi:hypothetical protein
VIAAYHITNKQNERSMDNVKMKKISFYTEEQKHTKMDSSFIKQITLPVSKPCAKTKTPLQKMETY